MREGNTTGLALRFALIVNAGLAVAFGAAWLQQAREGRFWASDFIAFYTAGRIVLRGDGAHLYDLEVQTATQAEIVPERGADDILIYPYPPHFALLAALLALLSREGAFFMWAAIQVAIVLGNRGLFARRMGEGLAFVAALAALLAFPGLFANFQLGQVSLLLTVALLGVASAAEADRPWRAAGWLVVASVKPQLALLAVLAILFWRGGSAVGRSALLFVPVALLTVALLGPWCWPEWVGIVRLMSEQVDKYGVSPDAMFNLRGRLFAWLGVERFALVNGIGLALLVGSLGLIAWLAWHGTREDAVGFRLRMALSLQVGLLATPHLNPADTLVFVVPALLLWDAAPRGRVFIAAVLLSCPLLLAVDLYGPVGGRPFVWVMVALAGVMGWLYRVHTMTAPEPSPQGTP